MTNILREVVLDTETTGLSTKDGHKIIEIGCVELINRQKTGRTFHSFLNPKRDIDHEAFQVHGLSREFLSDKPLFSQIAQEFYNFIDKSKLIIHNAAFDVGFLNYELSLGGFNLIKEVNVIDTLLLARKKYPGKPASLDALCKKFNISLMTRKKHGALIDAQLLASVYIMLQGINQSKIEMEEKEYSFGLEDRVYFEKRTALSLLQQEEDEHEMMLKQIPNSIWKQLEKE